MKTESIHIKTDKKGFELWADFMAKVRKQKKEAWDIIEPMVRGYLK